jgi:hypothetical protein
MYNRRPTTVSCPQIMSLRAKRGNLQICADLQRKTGNWELRTVNRELTAVRRPAGQDTGYETPINGA